MEINEEDNSLNISSETSKNKARKIVIPKKINTVNMG